jgi:hypothetical protein
VHDRTRITFFEKVNSIEEKKMNRQKRKSNITIAALKVFLGAALLMLVLSAPAYADTIVVFSDGNGCGGSTCWGNVVTLTIHSTGGIGYTVTMTVNTLGNYNPGGVGIGGVDFKFGAGGILTADLTSFNGGATTGWTEGVTNGLNSNGCFTTNGSSFGCSTDSAFLLASASALAPLDGSTYTWVWTATANGTVDGNLIHAGVLFGDFKTTGPPKNPTTSFQSTGIISAQTPEPSSLALFGTGLVTVAGFVRRRTRRNA